MKNLDPLDVLLKEVKLFSTLDSSSLDLLKTRMKRTSLEPGEVLFSEGEPGDRMYVVTSGELCVLKKGKGGSSIEIARLQSGEVAGEMSLFEEESRSATLKAVGNVELWEIDQKTFHHLLDTQPTMTRSLLAVLSRNLRRETRIVAELRSHDEDNRLKVAVFDSKPYMENILTERNEDRYALKFFDTRLSLDTVSMASGFKIICVFVNDIADAEVIEQLGNMGIEMVALRCAGYNNVDLQACADRRINVTRVPAYSPYAVAEHAVALMLGLNRHIHRAHNRVREGNFSLDGLVGFDMHGKTVGVIGTGKIGKCVISILLGFGCRVLAFDRYADEELAKLESFEYVELDKLFAESDIITLHAPLVPETRYIINDESIEKMKPGVMLINTSRGGLLNTQALIKGLLSEKIGSAGLDVFEEESGYFFEDFSDSMIADETLARLTTFNNVMVTSHMAFLTREALINIADTTYENIREYEAGGRGAELTNHVAPQ